jgi:hypothetical protein
MNLSSNLCSNPFAYSLFKLALFCLVLVAGPRTSLLMALPSRAHSSQSSAKTPGLKRKKVKERWKEENEKITHIFR